MATRTFTTGVRTATSQSAEPSFCIEYAKSGRSTCTECRKTVANKALRLGVGAAASYKWQHWACVTERTNGKIGTPDQLQGLSWLRAHDQAAVRQRFPGAGGKAPRKTGVRTLFD